jgi:hypothetical protein
VLYDGQSRYIESGGIISSDGGSDVTLRGVCWSTNTNPTILDDTTINGSGTGNFTSLVDNLEYNTTYYLRAYATNSNGTGYGEELTFATTSNVTLIPDPNFEQSLIDKGYDDVVDGAVLSSNINSVTDLNVGQENISDMTGIEGFVALNSLICDYNVITILDVSQNTALNYLNCNGALITSLDLSQNYYLSTLIMCCSDVSCLNVKNCQISNFFATNNPNLNCIEVDDPAWSTANWTDIDAGTTFSNNCNYPAGCF